MLDLPLSLHGDESQLWDAFSWRRGWVCSWTSLRETRSSALWLLGGSMWGLASPCTQELLNAFHAG